MRKTLCVLLAVWLLVTAAAADEIERDPASRSSLEPVAPTAESVPVHGAAEESTAQPQPWAGTSQLLAGLAKAKAGVQLGLHPPSVYRRHTSVLSIAHERIGILNACARTFSLKPAAAAGTDDAFPEPEPAVPVELLDITWLARAKASVPGVVPVTPPAAPQIPEIQPEPGRPDDSEVVPVPDTAPDAPLAGLLAGAKAGVQLPLHAPSRTAVHKAAQLQAQDRAAALSQLKGEALSTLATVELLHHGVLEQAAHTTASAIGELKVQFTLVTEDAAAPEVAVEETEVKSQVEPEGKDELRLATNRSLDDAAAMRGLEQSAADETEEVADEAASTEQDVAAPAAEEHPEPVGMVEIPETPETAEPVVAEPVADTTTETAPETLAPGFMLEVAPDSAVPPPSSFDLPDVADFNWPPKMPEYDVSPQLHEISRGNRRVKQLALTFDDGPHPEYTSQLLETLAAYEVPATFFFVGIQAKAHPQWVRETYAAGHELASQTYDHYRLPKLPLEEKVYQIDEYQRLIEGLVGMTPRFLRPPGGQLDPQTRQLLKDRGMVMALWDVATNDTKPGASRDDILRTMKRGLRPGTIILAHDGVQATIDALPEFIEYARNRGYEFVTMSELAAGLN